MVKAQEYINKNYPKESRNGHDTLNLKSKSLEGELDLSTFVNLKTINVYDNKITNINISKLDKLENLTVPSNELTKLDFGKATKSLKILNIADNKFPSQDLSIFSVLENIENLSFGNYRQIHSTYNKFHGSLKPLENLKKLKYLYISDTEVDSGLEYLPISLGSLNYVEGKVKFFNKVNFPGIYSMMIKQDAFLFQEINKKDEEIAQLRKQLASVAVVAKVEVEKLREEIYGKVRHFDIVKKPSGKKPSGSEIGKPSDFSGVVRISPPRGYGPVRKTQTEDQLSQESLITTLIEKEEAEQIVKEKLEGNRPKESGETEAGLKSQLEQLTQEKKQIMQELVKVETELQAQVEVSPKTGE